MSIIVYFRKIKNERKEETARWEGHKWCCERNCKNMESVQEIFMCDKFLVLRFAVGYLNRKYIFFITSLNNIDILDS